MSVPSLKYWQYVARQPNYFKLHVSYIVNKALRMYGFVVQSCRMFQITDCIKRLYVAYVRSILEYCLVVWNPYYENYKYDIKKVQNQFLRYIHYKESGEYRLHIPRIDIMKTYNLKPLDNRRKIASIMFLYQLVNNFIADPDLIAYLNFHQDGSLCAQHCLNSLLQGPYFTAVDLGTLANRLDEEEREQMAEGGLDSEDYRKFLQQPSSNMDDSGYFSVQVISSALQVWGLELVPYCSNDSRAKSALDQPSRMQAFICNYKDHWLSIRKIGNQWFNLNSLLAKPQLISDTYLALFLAQLRTDGYSIFIVFGELPECTADEILRNNPIESFTQHRQPIAQGSSSESDPDMQAALRLSLQDSNDQLDSPDIVDRELQEALRLSMHGANISPEEEEEDEDVELKKAITMSLQCL
ncbi:unnamed protein product [Ceutorhynchus assimilis]|uniref:ubiquitinyl hydrolase 1 n=1 Tax=Ceutorhynchus assimilis TaxID=467358 RepID=A0A9N9MEQ7_9CUCU|nr:unnamed protein product [Ceutorhynchus assimilis]